MKLDVLIITAHPDDAEFSMGGTILKLLVQGKKVGIADFTQGERATRGSTETRKAEAAEADRRLSLTVRINLGFRDCFFAHDEAHVLDVIRVIRRFQPEMIFSNPKNDRHPDHGRVHSIVKDAVFFSGLPKIETLEGGKVQDAWRPSRLFHYIQAFQEIPQFIVDVTEHWIQKRHVIGAYESQIAKKEGCTEPDTIMTQKDFLGFLEARDRVMGQQIGATYGEGFLSDAPLKIDDVGMLI